MVALSARPFPAALCNGYAITCMHDSRKGFAELQRRYFEAAEVERFRWTTGSAGFAETEDELLSPVLDLIESPCLEIGCGEGNNLVRLGRRARCFGVDLFRRKLHFAARAVPHAVFTVAEATALPFSDAAFGSVFIRDLLHHVPHPADVVAQAVRVLAPGGTLCILEPNGRNPIVLLQTLLVAAEARARESDVDHLTRLLRKLPLGEVRIETRQPLPLRRMALHYRYGVPALGRSAGLRRVLAATESWLGRLLPAERWSYVLVTARRN